jgi:biopolymer transport protein ExbB
MFVDFDWFETLKGSPILVVLGACSMISFAIAIERVLYYRRRMGNADLALERALNSVSQSDLAGAVRACEDCEHPLGSVAPEVLSMPGASQMDTEERLQILLSQQKLLLERNVGLLGTMAAIAPLIGLLGTVWGIMRAFNDMSQTGSAAPAIVAGGVSEALLTTAAGLVVAVPSVMLYNHFNRRMNVMLTVAENHTRTIRNRMSVMASAENSAPQQQRYVAPNSNVIDRGERIAAEALDVTRKMLV